MSVYDNEPEDGFWMLWEASDGDISKYEMIKNMKWSVVATWVDNRRRMQKELEEKQNGSN